MKGNGKRRGLLSSKICCGEKVKLLETIQKYNTIAQSTTVQSKIHTSHIYRIIATKKALIRERQGVGWR